jgi:hypothetical protein
MRLITHRVASFGGPTFSSHLFIIPVIYSIFVLDLRIIKWAAPEREESVLNIDSGPNAVIGSS